MTDSVMVLGTRYSIEVKKFEEDPKFKKLQCDGYTEELTKRIVLCDTHSNPGYECYSEEEHKLHMKDCLRHEIVHAFLNESGLSCCAGSVSCWAQTEEIVDWIALQGPKIYEAWKECGALKDDAEKTGYVLLNGDAIKQAELIRNEKLSQGAWILEKAPAQD